jgi:hypothetical protein
MILFLAGAVYIGRILFSPLPLRVIDRDQSGFVSFMEALDSLDVGTRPLESKPGYIEYFWLKDGLTVDEQCR